VNVHHPPRKKYQVTLCSSCHYSFCVDCLLEKVLSLPMEIQNIILEKWFWLSNTRHNYDIPLAPMNNNRAYFGAVRYPYHRLVYIYDLNLRWIDYYAILQYTHAYERVSIIMCCEEIMSPFSH